MTTKKMRLFCLVTPTQFPELYNVSANMYDGTAFDLKVNEHKVVLNEPLSPDRAVEGWMEVEHVGEQNDRASIVLPAPSITYGTNVTVSTLKLMPYNMAISSFSGHKVIPKKTRTKKQADENPTSDDNGSGQ